MEESFRSKTGKLSFKAYCYSYNKAQKAFRSLACNENVKTTISVRFVKALNPFQNHEKESCKSKQFELPYFPV